MFKQYELEVKSNNKTYKQYNVGDDLFIGVGKDEEFEVVFKNNTSNPVQVRLSLDGTDILTGAQASTDAKGEMWYVGARDKLVLKAWPESSSGGAKFIFSDSKKSVAAHTHGNMSGRGIIAAAVYVEKYTNIYCNDIYLWNNGANVGGSILRSKNLEMPKTEILCSLDASYSRDIHDDDAALDYSSAKPGIGASEYAEQKLTKVAGLREPGLNQILYLHYDWWDNLKKQLKPTKQMQAFPGDDNFVGIDLKNTPRKGKSTKKSPAKKAQLERFV